MTITMMAKFYRVKDEKEPAYKDVELLQYAFGRTLSNGKMKAEEQVPALEGLVNNIGKAALTVQGDAGKTAAIGRIFERCAQEVQLTSRTTGRQFSTVLEAITSAVAKLDHKI